MEEVQFDKAVAEALRGSESAKGMSDPRSCDGARSMRIAIVMSGKKVSPHFGKAEEIMLVEVEDGDIKDREILPAPPHEYGALPALLKKKGVKRLVTGNIGERALEHLEAADIRVYSGAKGSVEDTLGSLLSGNLVSREIACKGGMGTCAGNASGFRAAGVDRQVDVGEDHMERR